MNDFLLTIVVSGNVSFYLFPGGWQGRHRSSAGKTPLKEFTRTTEQPFPSISFPSYDSFRLLENKTRLGKKKNAVKTSIELQTSRPNFLVSYDSVFNRGNELY